MKKKIPAMIAAICAAALAGCGPSADPHGGPDTDSSFVESIINSSWYIDYKFSILRECSCSETCLSENLIFNTFAGTPPAIA